MPLLSEFFYYGVWVDTQGSEEHSAVSDQESGIGGQWSGVITGVKSLSILE